MYFQVHEVELSEKQKERDEGKSEWKIKARTGYSDTEKVQITTRKTAAEKPNIEKSNISRMSGQCFMQIKMDFSVSDH